MNVDSLVPKNLFKEEGVDTDLNAVRQLHPRGCSDIENPQLWRGRAFDCHDQVRKRVPNFDKIAIEAEAFVEGIGDSQGRLVHRFTRRQRSEGADRVLVRKPPFAQFPSPAGITTRPAR